jgi:hypothetical protein
MKLVKTVSGLFEILHVVLDLLLGPKRRNCFPGNDDINGHRCGGFHIHGK